VTADPRLTPEQVAELRELAHRLQNRFNAQMSSRLDKVKALYVPFDPDSDCVDLPPDLADPPPSKSDEQNFIDALEDLLIKANYRHLDDNVIQEAVESPNQLGLNYVPNFGHFEYLRVWARGEVKLRRTARSWYKKFRKVEVVYDGYHRLVVMIKFKPGQELGDLVSTDAFYVRLYKDVPHVDMEMHLPEQSIKVRMRAIDKAQIASPMAVSLPTALWKTLFSPVLWKLFKLGFLTFAIPINLMAALIVAPVMAGVNSFMGFKRAKQKHLHFMIRQLYYLTLANNMSAITWLADSAKEEEFKEAFLAYSVLWMGRDDPGAWSSKRLDNAIETMLRKRVGTHADFEISDAIAKLRVLGLVSGPDRGPLVALDLTAALARLAPGGAVNAHPHPHPHEQPHPAPIKTAPAP
jgi:hypothetical protein